MIEWLKLTDERKRQVVNQVNNVTGLPVHAIEKDWWVTLTLKAIFSTGWAGNLVFKGGTSLSKAWRLIERFSEDIDLAIDRKLLGYPEEFVSNAQVAKLRKKASAFISNEFRNELEKKLLEMGVAHDQFKLSVQETDTDDRDPQVLVLGYHSALDPDVYIAGRVLIEIGARSMREPSANREIKTIMHEVFPDQSFSGTVFLVETVEPKRTFLEKAFLLHEEFLKPPERIRHDRLSRHLYDLERLMDTEHAAAALDDYDFYTSIIDHRQKFNQIRGMDYSLHVPSHINFIPPDALIKQWENDYAAMRQSMIYGQAHEFSILIQRLHKLLNRFRLVLLTEEITNRSEELKIDKNLLMQLIGEAKTYELPSNAYSEGAEVIIPVTRLTDIYKPAGENNKTIRYALNFKREKGNLVFVSIGIQ